jgi:hypothetical protein
MEVNKWYYKYCSMLIGNVIEAYKGTSIYKYINFI